LKVTATGFQVGDSQNVAHKKQDLERGIPKNIKAQLQIKPKLY